MKKIICTLACSVILSACVQYRTVYVDRMSNHEKETLVSAARTMGFAAAANNKKCHGQGMTWWNDQINFSMWMGLHREEFYKNDINFIYEFDEAFTNSDNGFYDSPCTELVLNVKKIWLDLIRN